MRRVAAAAVLALNLALVSAACHGDPPARTQCPDARPREGTKCDDYTLACRYGSSSCRYDVHTWSCYRGVWLEGSMPGDGPGCPSPSTPTPDADTCSPGMDETYTVGPTWHPPTGFNQGKCTNAQADAVVDCDLGQLTSSPACATFDPNPANDDCRQCAVSRWTATAYGPIVEGALYSIARDHQQPTESVQVNIAGCIAQATGDFSITGCASKVLGATECESVACRNYCPVAVDDHGPGLAKLLACEALSRSTVCKNFVADAMCADALTADGGAASVCAQTGASFADNAKRMVKLFCGGRILDAGITDAADGG
jgi:hypothetical protein